MSIARITMGAGLSGGQALAINAGVASVTAAGTTQAGAFALSVGNNVITSASINAGVVLPFGAANDEVVVYNSTANSIKVYPPLGATLNNLAVNIAQALLPNEMILAKCISYTAWDFLKTSGSGSAFQPFMGEDGEDGEDGATMVMNALAYNDAANYNAASRLYLFYNAGGF
tara:strand:+ start:2490 stop:3005 length:516 start_codon:yes stop_codon:yes gene_type:complete